MGEWLKKFFGGIGFGDVGSLISAIGNIVQVKKARETNEKLVRETNANNRAMQDKANETNIQLMEMSNAAQAAENEKAYARSMAGNQVNLMTQAGMSRAGAINALNGGGSYTPAPVNTAQVEASRDEAPQIQPLDFSGLMQAFAMMSSNAAQARITEQQLKQQKEQFDMEQDLRERQFNEQALNNKVARDLTQKQIELAAEQLNLSVAQTKKLTADTDLTIAQLQTEIAKYDMTVAQVAQIQEQMKLTTAQILQVKASTKLTEQQVKTEFERTGLTHQQVEIAAKEFVRLSQEVDEFMSLSAIDQRERAREYESQILRFARDMKMNERDISNFERTIDKTPGGFIANLWAYVASRVVPLKGLVSLKGN